MDMLKISSAFMKGVLNLCLSKMIQKKLGYKIDILVNELEFTTVDGKVHLHMDVDGEMDNEEFRRIMKSIF